MVGNVALLYVNTQVPEQIAWLVILLKTSTVCAKVVYSGWMGGVLHCSCVVVAAKTSQNQFIAPPTNTWFSAGSGLKLRPVIVRIVPPLILPVSGLMEVTTTSYTKVAAPTVLSMELPNPTLETTTLKVPGRPPGSLTSSCVSLIRMTLSW